MNKTIIKNLIRKTYNDIASKNESNEPVTKYGLDGVNIKLAQLNFLAHPSPEAAVDVVVTQLQAELSKIEEREIPREKWPRFFQDDQWVEKTYKKFGLTPPAPATLPQDAPTTTIDKPEGKGSSANNIVSGVIGDIFGKDKFTRDRIGKTDTFGEVF